MLRHSCCQQSLEAQGNVACGALIHLQWCGPCQSRSVTGWRARQMSLHCIAAQQLTLLCHVVQFSDPHDLNIKGVEQRPIHVDEIKTSLEVMLCGSSIGVVPVTHWDDDAIHDGTPGIIALALHKVLKMHQMPTEDSYNHVAVPYGYLTGMREQLI